MDFMHRPSADAVDEAYDGLLLLGCIDTRRCLTPLGEQVLQLACDPRGALMILAGARIDKWACWFACFLVAALEMSDPWKLVEYTPAYATGEHMVRYALGDLQLYGEVGFEFFDPMKDFQPRQKKTPQMLWDLRSRAMDLLESFDNAVGFHPRLRIMPLGAGGRDQSIRAVVGAGLKLQTAHRIDHKAYALQCNGGHATIERRSLLDEANVEALLQRARESRNPNPGIKNMAKSIENQGLPKWLYYWERTWFTHSKSGYNIRGLLLAPVNVIRQLNPAFAGGEGSAL